MSSRQSNGGMSHYDRIKLLIERSFNTQEEQTRIMDTVRMLDKKSRTDAAGHKPLANLQPDESYVYGDHQSKENYSDSEVQLFDGQLAFTATQPLPTQAALPPPKVVTHVPSSSSSRPSSANSLDALLGSSSSVSSQGSYFKPPAAPMASSVAPAKSVATKPTSSSSSSSNKPNQPRPSLPPRPTGQPDIATMFPNKKKRTTDTVEAIVMSDFNGVENVCGNAGASQESLEAVLQMILLDGPCDVVLSAVYSDLKSSHHSVTNKYCTASVLCTNWFCTCDRHIRAVESTERLIGVAFIICHTANVPQTPAEEKQVYFLPLVNCMEPTASQQQRQLLQPHSVSDADSIILPLDCSSSLDERWSALMSILSAESVRKIVFNCQLFLFPVMNHLRQQLHRQQQHVKGITETCTSLWDPKIASYLVSSDIAEESLELYSLLGKYRIHCRQQNYSHTTASSLATSSSSCEGVAAESEGRMTRLFTTLREEMLCLHRMTQMQEAEMSRSDGLTSVFTSIEMPVVALLSSMESAGIHCSVEYLHSMHRELSAVISELEAAAKDMIRGSRGEVSAADSFNLASPEQVAQVLYGQFKLPTQGGATSGARHASTSEESLKKIRHLHPMVDVILQFRAANKLLTTYCGSSLTQFVHTHSESHAASGAVAVRCIHANWNQTIVRTGRLSCSKPNLQNIPNQQKVGHLDVNIRQAMEAPPGCVLVSADYSQIEMRVLAHLCQDPAMTALFHRDKDIYRQLAGRILNKAPERVTSEERDTAKVVCLGVLYGMGPQATAAKLGIDVARANQITHSFFNHFKKMKTWIQNIKSQAKQHGYVRTLLGRRRYLPDIHSTDKAKSAQGERQAVNSVIQGTASDVIKYAMINVDKALASYQGGVSRPSLVMQIHDELIYSFPVEYEGTAHQAQERLTRESAAALHQFVQLLHHKMSEEVVGVLGLKVPLLVNVKWGRCWGSLSDYQPAAFDNPRTSIGVGGSSSSTTVTTGVEPVAPRMMTVEEEEEQLLRMMDSVEAQYQTQLQASTAADSHAGEQSENDAHDNAFVYDEEAMLEAEFNANDMHYDEENW